MYKGYKVIEDEANYKIKNEDGTVCGVIIKEGYSPTSEKAIIEKLIRHRKPKKPKKELKTEVKGERFAVKVLCLCPDCGWILGEINDEYKYHHCANCGQVIDWSMNIENYLKWYININKGAGCEVKTRLLARLKRIIIMLKEKPPDIADGISTLIK